MENNSEKSKSHLNKAREYFTAKQYRNARLMYFQALNQVEDNETRAIIWAELSWVFYYEKNLEKAAEAAENVIIYDPEYKALEDVYRVQGYAFLGMKKYALAEKYLAQSLAVDSGSDKQQLVKYELGKLYFTQGNYDQAYPYFHEIIEFFDRSDSNYAISCRFYLGFILYYLNNHKAARESFEQILTSDPADQQKAAAQFGLAFLEFHEKNYLTVISICEKVMVLDPNFFDKESLGFLTAASYFHLGRRDIFEQYYHQMQNTYQQGRYKKDLEKLYLSDPGTSTPSPGDKSN